MTNDVAVRLCGVLGIKQGGVGANLHFDASSLRFTKYDATAFWFTDVYRLAIRHISTDKAAYSFGNLAMSVFYNWCPKLKLAGVVTHQSEKEIDIKLGLQYETEDKKIFKARIDQDASIGISVRTKINQYLTLVTASQFNFLDRDASLFQFGIRMKVNQ